MQCQYAAQQDSTCRYCTAVSASAHRLWAKTTKYEDGCEAQRGMYHKHDSIARISGPMVCYLKGSLQVDTLATVLYPSRLATATVLKPTWTHETFLPCAYDSHHSIGTQQHVNGVTLSSTCYLPTSAGLVRSYQVVFTMPKEWLQLFLWGLEASHCGSRLVPVSHLNNSAIGCSGWPGEG